jgi:hypothetical protein
MIFVALHFHDQKLTWQQKKQVVSQEMYIIQSLFILIFFTFYNAS